MWKDANSPTDWQGTKTEMKKKTISFLFRSYTQVQVLQAKEPKKVNGPEVLDK